jgi:NitT/TauT family transport system substrate-binding protein
VIENTEVSQALVDQHVRATEFIAESPSEAAADAASVIGSGVSENLASEAMGSRASDFVSDPHSITDQASTMADFVAAVGNIAEPVPTAALFAFEAYDATQQ